jgi:cytochrome P450
LDERFLWLFPERQRLHRELERFNKMIESIIVEKREKIKDGFYDVSEDHEKDLLTLMLETESSEGYSMTNEDIQVSFNNE